jgi:hypothetical protein
MTMFYKGSIVSIFTKIHYTGECTRFMGIYHRLTAVTTSYSYARLSQVHIIMHCIHTECHGPETEKMLLVRVDVVRACGRATVGQAYVRMHVAHQSAYSGSVRSRHENAAYAYAYLD